MARTRLRAVPRVPVASTVLLGSVRICLGLKRIQAHGPFFSSGTSGALPKIATGSPGGRTMRRWSWSSFGLWLVVALLTPTAEARAQDLTADRVRFALDRTDERIALAQSLVTGAKNAQASLEVEAAVGLQAQARAAFDQGMSASGDIRLHLFQQAVDLTLRARSSGSGDLADPGTPRSGSRAVAGAAHARAPRSRP